MAWEVGMEPVGRWGEAANAWPVDCVPSSPPHICTGAAGLGVGVGWGAERPGAGMKQRGTQDIGPRLSSWFIFLCSLKAVFLFRFSNCCLDVILLFCFFNFVSALLISVALPMSLCPSLPLSLVSPSVSIPKPPESLSLSLYLWVSVPSSSEPPLPLPGPYPPLSGFFSSPHPPCYQSLLFSFPACSLLPIIISVSFHLPASVLGPLSFAAASGDPRR